LLLLTFHRATKSRRGFVRVLFPFKRITKLITVGHISSSAPFQQPREVYGGVEETCITLASITSSAVLLPVAGSSVELPTLHPGDIPSPPSSGAYSAASNLQMQSSSSLEAELLPQCTVVVFIWKGKKEHHVCAVPAAGRGGRALCRSPRLCLTSRPRHSSNDHP